MTDDKIILASKILKEEYLRLDDHENIIPNRDKVLNNYKDIFSSKKIRTYFPHFLDRLFFYFLEGCQTEFLHFIDDLFHLSHVADPLLNQ